MRLDRPGFKGYAPGRTGPKKPGERERTMANLADAPPLQAGAPVALRFTGRAGEYFRIWIVNVCLSVVTLGIYSPWAKVRRKRYFYGNTLLAGEAFDYLADPKAILKGRLIVGGALLVYSVASKTDVPGVPFLFGLAYLGLLPAIVIAAARFNALNSAHRGVRFGFHATYGETLGFLVLPVFLVPLSLGLLYPYYVFRRRAFFAGHSSYGTTPFAFESSAGRYYATYLKAALLFIAFVIGSVVTLGLGALPLYLLFAAYRDAAVARLNWSHTRLGELGFECRWTAWGLWKLYLVNTVGLVFTLGLAAPWVHVRTARYQLERISVGPADRLGEFVAASREGSKALGDEALGLLGFDVGL